ncbi:1,3-beta-galactosyl-N-acetylhexosamine phosphorylase N-terminal domain-containing protein [Bacillus pacificus]
MKRKKGRVTLPSEENFLKETKELMERWGADAIRDSDGTKLDDDIKQLDAKIYTTYFVARAHNEFAEKHLDECQQLYLMSLFNTALTDTLEIDFMKGYFEEQLKPDYVHSPKNTGRLLIGQQGEVVDVNDWEVNEDQNRVLITKAIPWHEYTVSF